MRKRILLIGFVLIILLMGIVNSETVNSDILSQIKKSSSGVSFTDNGFGGVVVKVNSLDNKIVYRDLQGNVHEVSGLLQNGQIELDSKGNIIKGNFVASKGVDLVLGGNLKVNIPPNSQLSGVDGKNFDVTLAPGSGVDKEPVSLSLETSGNSIVNYKLNQKSNVKFPDFSLQEGVISHNGKYFVIKGGNTAVVNSVSLYSLGKEGDNPIFFDEKKVPADLKSGHSVVDFKKMIIKNIGGDGKTQTIMIRPGNPIVPISDKNKLGFKAGQNGQVNLQNGKTVIYPYAQGKFVMQNGNLYLYRQANGLVGSFNNQNGKYDIVPVDMSFSNADGSILLRDKEGHALGLMVRQGQNGWPQVQTGVALSPENPNLLTTPQKEMPNWQHNPDNSPVDSPITPSSTPITPVSVNPPAAPASQYPFTKEDFLRDIFHTPTKFPASMIYNNVGEALKSTNIPLYEKHFRRGSMTTMEETLADYKALIENEARKYGTNSASLAETFKGRQPALYNKYGKYLGFK